MFSSKRFPWVVGILALWAVPPSFGEVPVTVTGGGTALFLDGKYELDNGTMPMGAIEFRLAERFGVEFTYARGEAEGLGDYDADIEHWRFDGLYYFSTKDKFYPYLAFGAGRTEREWDRPAPPDGFGGDDADEQLNIGAGFRYYLSDHVSVRADGRWLHSMSEDRDDIGISFGLSYSFQPLPSPPPPPAPPPEPPPADSDGDGVPDSMDECPNTPPGTEVDSRGCRVKTVKIASIKLTVNFAFDSHTVEEYEFEDIASLALFLQRFEEITVEIEGHTDSTGPDLYNQGLSERRAAAVVSILRDEHGIAGHRLRPVGYGESRPVASNDTREGRAENRRVVASLEVEYLE